MEKATFAGGCFWAMEEAFAKTEGVVATRVGYMGGDVPDPTHEAVRQGATGHAEAVEVTYDPLRVDYDDLLEVFWSAHDPTQLDRQGADIGPAYRSTIFCHTAEQCDAAQRSRTVQSKMKRFRNAIVTELQPATTFYPAGESHQHFVAKERARNRLWSPPIAEATADSRGRRTK